MNRTETRRAAPALAACLLLIAAHDATAEVVTYNVSGSLANSANGCNNVVVGLTNNDCSYAKTRSPPSPVWQGPSFAAAFYPRNGSGDDIDHVSVPGDGKLSVSLSGTVTIDDKGTPDGADDSIAATWTFGAAAFNVITNAGDQAVERWDSFVHTLADRTVDQAIAQPGGGFRYVIGARGIPTPEVLTVAGTPGDTFPSENAPGSTGSVGFWDGTAAGVNPASARTGIERSPGFGAFGVGQPLTPNAGATTTGVLVGYSCTDNAGDNDCTANDAVFGNSGPWYRNEDGTVLTPTEADPSFGNCVDDLDNDGTGGTDEADPNCTGPNSRPGFENVVLVLTTDGDGAITAAQALWTREYVVLAGPSIGSDATGTYGTDNTWIGGRFSFTGATGGNDPVAEDDTATIQEDQPTPINVRLNDTLGEPQPNVLAIVTPPEHGTATVTGDTITYTPDALYAGPDSFVYSLTDDDGGTDSATVTLTVTQKLPTAGDFTATSVDAETSDPINVLVPPTLLGSGTSAQHVVTVTGVATGGSCTVSGSRVTFAPAQSFNGTGSCEFLVTDADGDADAGTLTVEVSGNPTIIEGGLASGGSSLGASTLLALLAALPAAARRRRVRPSAGSA